MREKITALKKETKVITKKLDELTKLPDHNIDPIWVSKQKNNLEARLREIHREMQKIDKVQSTIKRYWQ